MGMDHRVSIYCCLIQLNKMRQFADNLEISTGIMCTIATDPQRSVME